MAAEDLVPGAVLGELLSYGVRTAMICDEDTVRKGRFVTITDGENWPPECHEADDGDPIGGVACEDGDTGDPISVVLFGLTKIYAGAAITVLDHLKSDDEGRAVPVAATDVKVGGARALMKAGEADDELIVFVDPGVQTQVIA